MSPKEFLEQMKEFYENEDTELAHIHMDELMCDVLSSFGYDEGVEFFERAYKWYA